MFLTWPADDQDKAIAYVALLEREEVEAGRVCSSCRTVPEDWIDPVTGRRLVEPRWIVEEVDECPGCAIIESAIGEIPEEERKRRGVRLREAHEADFDDFDEDDGM